MARPLRIEFPGAFYHITSRGIDQKAIFRSRQDREKFLFYLESATSRYGAVIHAYCLMGNHYHLFLETPRGNLSQIMRHINGAYTTYFNLNRGRSGHLFQGRYKAILVEVDGYAREISRYIHLKPVLAGVVYRPEEFPWSSYRFYTGGGSALPWLKTDFILGYFGEKPGPGKERYRQFVEEGLERKAPNPLAEAVASTILGRPDFVTAVREKHLYREASSRDVPALKKLSSRPSLEEISSLVKDIPQIEKKWVKNASLYLCHRFSGASLKEIGAYYGIGESAVSQASRRFARRLREDRQLASLVGKIEARLSCQ